MQPTNYGFFEQDNDQLESEDIVEYDITTSPRDLTPANIVDMIDSGIMEIPLFQRNFVWDIKKASRLVESLILGLPVPELFFYSDGDENTTYKIIDGQQRLLSIYFFVKGRFPKSTTSRIEMRNYFARWDEEEVRVALLEDNRVFQDFELDLNEKDDPKKNIYHKVKFTLLDKGTQTKFRLRRYLRTVVVRQNKPDDDCSSMFEIFNRLNTGGTPLSHQEIRASLYYCDFYKMLLELNENEEWRSLLGKPTQELHCTDVELILRSIALLVDEKTYKPKMVSFLNDFSKKSKTLNDDKINYLYDLFLSFIGACSTLPKKAFFRNNRFSKTLFESVFVAICRNSFLANSIKIKKIDSKKFELLKNDPGFVSYLQSGSSSSESIKQRFKRATELLIDEEN